MIDFLKHLSYSNIQLFEECPRCWLLKYKYDYQLPVPPSWEFGRTIHKAIEDYHLLRKIPQDQEILKYVRVYSSLFKSKDYDDVEKMYEVPIIHPFNDEMIHPLKLVVRIDRIHKGWIHDVKTASGKWKQEDVDGRTQTALYSYAYRQTFHKDEEGVQYDVLIKRKGEPTLQPLPTYCSKNDIDKALMWIWQTWDKMVADYEEGIEVHKIGCKRAEYMP